MAQAKDNRTVALKASTKAMSTNPTSPFESEHTSPSDAKSPVEPGPAPTTLFEGDVELFPTFYLSTIEPRPRFNKTGQKSKSLTQAEIESQVITPSELAVLNERLKTEPPPLSLQQARERRASIKQERKRTIEFIRSRTSSRAAALGIPIPGSAANEHSKPLSALTEGVRRD